MDLAIIIISIVSVISQIAQNTTADRMIALIAQESKLYYNLDSLVQWDDANWSLLGFLVFFFNIRVLRLLEFSKRLSLFVEVLKELKKEISSFGVFFIFVFLAFALGFNLVLFKFSYSYRTLLSTANSLLILLLGKVFTFLFLCEG